MMRSLRLSLICLAYTAFPAMSADITAFVDRTSINYGESVQLTVTSTGSDTSVDVSAIRDFNVVSSGTSTSVQIVNGQMTRSVSYNYTLIPLKSGRLTIPPLAVKAGGKTYKTSAIVVSVSKQPHRKRADRALFAEAKVSNPSPYEGEQLIYTFRFFHQVQISNPRFQKPGFNGFTAKEIGDFKTYTSVIAGKRYTVSEISYVLIPIKSGKTNIEPATLQCDVVKQTSRRSRSSFDSIFDDPFFGRRKLEPRILQTPEITVNVKPLPAAEDGGAFSGLVGEFAISAQLEADSLHVGKSTTLTVTVEGKGNIMDADEPPLAIPDGFKAYKDAPEDHIELTTAGYSGKKIFRIALVPVSSGNYTLPKIPLRYFDPSSGKHRIQFTDALSLSALPAEETEALEAYSAAAPGAQKPVLKKRVKLMGSDILPLNESLESLTDHNPLSFNAFLAFLVIPGILYLILRLSEKRFREDSDPRTLMVNRAAASLKAANRDRSDDDVFLTSLYRTMVSMVLARANMIGESLTYSEVKEILLKSGYASELADTAARLLERIESAKFSGGAMNGTSKQQLYEETQDMFKKLG